MESGGKAPDVFCSESISKGVFYKGRHSIAVVDIAPVMPGHTLVIPTRHVLDITELSAEEMGDIHLTLKKVTPIVLRIYGDSSMSYDITSQIGEYSGMSVRHLHIHIIPRKKDDKYQSKQSVYDAIEHVERLPEKEYSRRVDLLRKELKWSE